MRKIERDRKKVIRKIEIIITDEGANREIKTKIENLKLHDAYGVLSDVLVKLIMNTQRKQTMEKRTTYIG